MRKPRRGRPKPKKANEPSWVTDDSGLNARGLSKQELDDLARNVKKGIHDTPAWKELVQRVGKGEAERILKLALYHEHGIAGTPNN